MKYIYVLISIFLKIILIITNSIILLKINFFGY